MKIQVNSKSGNIQTSDDGTTTQIQVGINWGTVVGIVIVSVIAFLILN